MRVRWCIVVKKAGKTKVRSGEGSTREKAGLPCSCYVYTTPHKYLSGSILLWYSSKHGTTHMGRSHCLQWYVVVLLPLPFFPLQTMQLVCHGFPCAVSVSFPGKCRSLRRAGGGSGQATGPVARGMSSAVFTATDMSIPFANSILNCSWVKRRPD